VLAGCRTIVAMGMTVVLTPLDDREVTLGPATAARLGALGVTNIAVLRDHTTVAVVLEGWAFDPVTTTHQALEVLTGPGRPVRTLSLVAQMTVSPGGDLEDGSET
jgi:hypothetical protein